MIRQTSDRARSGDCVAQKPCECCGAAKVALPARAGGSELSAEQLNRGYTKRYSLRKAYDGGARVEHGTFESPKAPR
jgi:hypothetical protein